jgi:hypothetical protein
MAIITHTYTNTHSNTSAAEGRYLASNKQNLRQTKPQTNKPSHTQNLKQTKPQQQRDDTWPQAEAIYK